MSLVIWAPYLLYYWIVIAYCIPSVDDKTYMRAKGCSDLGLRKGTDKFGIVWDCFSERKKKLSSVRQVYICGRILSIQLADQRPCSVSECLTRRRAEGAVHCSRAREAFSAFLTTIIVMCWDRDTRLSLQAQHIRGA